MIKQKLRKKKIDRTRDEKYETSLAAVCGRLRVGPGLFRTAAR